MKLWKLDVHPILERFRAMLPKVKRQPGRKFHIFLSPPYALPAGALKRPLRYVFIVSPLDESTLVNYSDAHYQVTLGKDAVSPNGITKFPRTFQRISILLSVSYTSSDDFSYLIHEMESDFYNPLLPPPLIGRIHQVYRNGDSSIKFLQCETSNESLRRMWLDFDQQFMVPQVTAENLNAYVLSVRDAIDRFADAVASLPIVRQIPIATRIALNFAVFNAITSKLHTKLITAFHQACADQNRRAQLAISRPEFRTTRDRYDKDELEVALCYLKSHVLEMPTTVDAILVVTKFFDSAIKAQRGERREPKADNILPVIVLAMSADPVLAAQVYSLFQYLVEIWPPIGIDDDITFKLVTCSIATTKLAFADANPSRPGAIPQPTTGPQPAAAAPSASAGQAVGWVEPSSWSSTSATQWGSQSASSSAWGSTPPSASAWGSTPPPPSAWASTSPSPSASAWGSTSRSASSRTSSSPPDSVWASESSSIFDSPAPPPKREEEPPDPAQATQTLETIDMLEGALGTL
jgi:hypothetical protein